MDLRDFGQNVKRVREKYLPGYSITKAAYKGLIHHHQLKKIEAGEWDLRLSTLMSIAENWEVPIEEFFCDKGESQKKARPVGKSNSGDVIGVTKGRKD